MSIEEQYNRAKDTLNGRLFAPYQREGVLWMLTMEGQKSGPKGGFLCDEMGLGKTVQLVSTMLGNPKPRTLIIVPKSIITQWVEEIHRFAPNLTVSVFDGPERKIDRNVDVTIAPYTLLTVKGGGPDAKTPLHMVQWDRVILDEAHEIRNKKSKLFKSVCRLQTQIKWIVTGTPVFNSMEDFVSLSTFLGLSKVVVQGMTNKIKDIYILRRTKEDLARINERLRLPPCHFENVELEMFPDEKQLYEVVFLEAQDTIREAFRHAQSLNAKNMIILECLLRARQAMIWPQMYLDGVADTTFTGTLTFGTGDHMMIAADADTGKVWIGKNGTWFNSGNPTAGTGEMFTATGDITPIWGSYKVQHKAVINFGQQPFKYDPPA